MYFGFRVSFSVWGRVRVSLEGSFRVRDRFWLGLDLFLSGRNIARRGKDIVLY